MSDLGEITVDDLLAEVTPRIISVRVLLRQELLDQHAEMDAELEAAVQRDRSAGERSIDEEPEATAIAARILELQGEIENAKREFVFKRIGKRAYSDLLAAHPPTAEQRRTSPKLDHNPETFPGALVAASCQSPKMTLDQVRKFEEVLDWGQFNQLYQAALDANLGGGDSPKSMLAGGIARVNAQLGLRPTTSESLDLSSLDGETTT